MYLKVPMGVQGAKLPETVADWDISCFTSLVFSLELLPLCSKHSLAVGGGGGSRMWVKKFRKQLLKFQWVPFIQPWTGLQDVKSMAILFPDDSAWCQWCSFYFSHTGAINMILSGSEGDRVAGKADAQVNESEPPSTFEEFLKKERLVCNLHLKGYIGQLRQKY